MYGHSNIGKARGAIFQEPRSRQKLIAASGWHRTCDVKEYKCRRVAVRSLPIVALWTLTITPTITISPSDTSAFPFFFVQSQTCMPQHTSSDSSVCSPR